MDQQFLGNEIAAISLVDARSLRTAANRGDVDHVLPVIGQSQLDKRFKQCVPNACCAQRQIRTFAVTLLHVALGATHPKDMQHAIHITPIVMSGGDLDPRAVDLAPQ